MAAPNAKICVLEPSASKTGSRSEMACALILKRLMLNPSVISVLLQLLILLEKG